MNTARPLVSLLPRMVLALTLFLLLSYWGQRHLVVEDDLIASLHGGDSTKTELFARYHSKSFFKDKIFIHVDGTPPEVVASLESQAQEIGYKRTPLIQPDMASITTALLPMIPSDELKAYLGNEQIQKRVNRLIASVAMPGGTEMLSRFTEDPLGLQEFSAMYLQRVLSGAAKAPEPDANPPAILMFQCPPAKNLEAIGKLYDALMVAPGVHFIGGDFFAYENYRAIKGDIHFCVSLSLVLSLFLFYFFTQTLRLPLYLFAGSIFSLASGIALAIFFDQKIYGIVLAFTSTFVSYNTETLVHLSGLDRRFRKRDLIAITSAIGTTLIGFIVLLAADSGLVRQAAIVSIGGTIGFLVLVLLFRDLVTGIRFRELRWPSYEMSPRMLFGLTGISIVVMIAIGWPNVMTRVEGFRYQSDRLSKEIVYFSQAAAEYQMDAVYGVEAASSLADLFSRYRQAMSKSHAGVGPHPFLAFADESHQRKTIETLNKLYPKALRTFKERLGVSGFRMDIPDQVPLFSIQSPKNYLNLLESSSPVRWSAEIQGKDFLFLRIPDDVVADARLSLGGSVGLVAMSPKSYYDELLTAGSRQMGILFLIGVIVQGFYLWYIQRRFVRVVYVLSPLVLIGAMVQIYFFKTGQAIHIIHFMGFGLVIGLAIDYTSVAVATDHGPKELNKILLTGLTTLASFGVLMFAKHPVLRDLGAVVSCGTILSLVFALVVRLRTERLGG